MIAVLISTILQVHKTWAWMMITSNALAGIWALGANRWPSMRSRALWAFTIFAELTILLQVTLGVLVIQDLDVQAPQFHVFYGVVAVLAATILYSYRIQMRHRLYLLYGFGGLFIAGLGIRAMMKA